MAKKPNVRTVPHGDAWAKRREGGPRVSKILETKADAQAARRKTAMRERSEHLIHTREGNARSSYGNDPARFKG